MIPLFNMPDDMFIIYTLYTICLCVFCRERVNNSTYLHKALESGSVPSEKAVDIRV